MKISVHFGLLPLIGILLVFDLQAQIVQNDTLKAKLGEVVVTANKINTSNRSVTQKVDVISRDEINTIISGNNNLAELIAKIPGASVSALSRNDANWGTYSGIGPKYSTYMLNGLPIDAFIDPMSIDFMVFERIEVQRGAASVLYPNYLSQDFAGVQSPLAGTVNLVLKENISNSSTQFSTSYGSYNTLNTQLFHQDFTEELNYFAGLNYENSDYTNYGTDNSWLNMKKNPAYRKTKLFAGTNYFLNDKSKVGLFINKTFHTGDAGRIYRGFDHDYTTINLNLKSEISDKTYFNVSAGYRNYDISLAELGFIVITIDGLGTAWRSKAFHDVSYKNLGDIGAEDHISGMKQLSATRPWMDLERVGIYGHSAGGYDAARALLTHPEFYKVAVSSAGNHDHRIAKAWWPEQYMGMPGKHYDEQSNFNLAGNLQGKLLLVHGDMDNNVNTASSLRLAAKLIENNKDFELLIIPNRNHGLADHPYFIRKKWIRLLGKSG